MKSSVANIAGRSVLRCRSALATQTATTTSAMSFGQRWNCNKFIHPTNIDSIQAGKNWIVGSQCSSIRIMTLFVNNNNYSLLRSGVSQTQHPPIQQPQQHHYPTLCRYYHVLSSSHHHRYYFSMSNYCKSSSGAAPAAPILSLQRDNLNYSEGGQIDIQNESAWKEFTNSLNEVVELPSISFPAQHVHFLLSDKDSPILPYLASHMAELEGVHPKVKLVRADGKEYGCVVDDSPVQRRKRILLDSRVTTTFEENAESNESYPPQPSSYFVIETDDTLVHLTRQYSGIPAHILQRLIHDYDAQPRDMECIHIPYQHQPISRILTKILPSQSSSSDNDAPPSSYEQIGHVAHFNLRQPHIPYGKLIGRVMLDRLQPSIRTVVNKLGEVGGPYRTYAMELLAGIDDYYVHVIEHGISLHFDLRKVYWCTRLEGERTYMIQNEFKQNQRIADAFCGVGALCIRAAVAKGCSVVANDLNPDAVEYCKESARRNGIDVSEGNANGRFHVRCGDASQFIMNLGMDNVSSDDEIPPTTTSSVDGATRNNNLPDHLLLNFPLDSPRFLNALRWWPSGADKCKSPPTRVHVYTFSRGDGERSASEVAIDMVADGLLPEGGYVEPSKFRGGYLNELGCDIQAREIRDAAPGKMVICVSFSVTRLLLRRMQGDYGFIRE